MITLPILVNYTQVFTVICLLNTLLPCFKNSLLSGGLEMCFIVLKSVQVEKEFGECYLRHVDKHT